MKGIAFLSVSLIKCSDLTEDSDFVTQNENIAESNIQARMNLF
jgi:hypothetical protein